MSQDIIETMSLSSISDSDEEIVILENHDSIRPNEEDNKGITAELAMNVSNLDDSETCPICFEAWTTSGSHRICCLRCGHLFGRSCVLRWLRTQRTSGKCPQCNSKACSRDIRVLFCKKIQAIDTTDRDQALADLEKERKLRRKTDLELSEYKFKHQLACNDAESLRAELSNLRSVLSVPVTDSRLEALSTPSSSGLLNETGHPIGSGRYSLVKSMLLSQIGKCRVVAACDYISLLCVSQPSGNPLFKGFGVRKVHTGELRPLTYMPLHSQPIRDLAFHPDLQDGIVASASIDKSVKLTSLLVDQVVQTYQCLSPVWSCCWASPSPNYIFAGCVNGSIIMFDIRVTSGPVETITMDANSSPVTALRYLAPDSNNITCQAGGLLVGQLTQVSFLEEMSTSPATIIKTYRAHPLPLEGSLISLSCVPSLRFFLASYRPSQRIPRVRHVFAEINSIRPAPGDPCTYAYNEVASLFGGTQMRMLSRGQAFFHESINQVLAVAGDDDANGALVWNCNTGAKLQTLIPPDTSPESPVLDVCALNGGTRLSLLTDRSVHVFQWSPSSTSA